MAELNNTSSGKWSETDGSNTSPSPDGWPSGTFPNQVEPIGRSTMGAIKRFWDRINGTVTTTGSANAYIYTPTNTSYPTAYVVGETYSFFANFSNTAGATININGLGAKNIYVKSSTGVFSTSGGEIHSGDLVIIMYDGTQFQIMSSIPSSIITNPTFSGTATLNTHPLLTQVKVQKFTSTGTYTPTTGMSYCTIEAWGGGGGGGGVGGSSTGQTAAAGGGGAGSYSRITLMASTIGSSQTITIGTAGSGASAGFNSGGNGGTTSVGTLCVANGGSGGFGSSGSQSGGTGGTGGTAGTGDIASPGQSGGSGNGSSGTSTSILPVSGAGASTLVGSGGIAVATGGTSIASGNSGSGYGSGGSGAANQNSGSTAGGGNGTQGYVIITEFISA